MHITGIFSLSYKLKHWKYLWLNKFHWQLYFNYLSGILHLIKLNMFKIICNYLLWTTADCYVFFKVNIRHSVETLFLKIE